MVDNPKSSGKGGDSDDGPMTRAGLVQTLEALIAELEARILPIQEQIRALRIIVEQENDSLSLDRRRQLRARERSRARPNPTEPTLRPS